MLFDVFWALSPLLLIIIAIACFNVAPDIAGAVAWVYCIAVACLYFHTDFRVALVTSWAGMVAALPISLVIAVAVLQVTVMVETGALARISVLCKTLAVHDRATQMLLLNSGLAIILCSLGAVPGTLLPPVLLALGYPVSQAIALSALGYCGASGFGLLGIPGQILAAFCGVSLEEAWYVLAWYMPLTNFAVAAGCLWFVGGWGMLRQGFVPALVVGAGCWVGAVSSAYLHLTPVGGVMAGGIILLFLVMFLTVRGVPVIERGLLTEQDLLAEQRHSLLAATSPWVMLTLIAVLINSPLLPLRQILFVDYAMTITIIPGHPEHLRVFSQPYLWLFVVTLACVPFLKPRPGLVRDCLLKWLRRMTRPFMAATLFFAIAYVFNHSGKDAAWELTGAHNNMISVLAAAAAQTFGMSYAAVAPFMGVIAGMICGSQAASTAMLTTLHMKTAALLGANGVLIAAGGAMGGGLAGMLSPAKLMSAAAAIDCQGQEGPIFRAFLGLCAVITLSVSLVCVILVLL